MRVSKFSYQRSQVCERIPIACALLAFVDVLRQFDNVFRHGFNPLDVELAPTLPCSRNYVNHNFKNSYRDWIFFNSAS